VWSERGVKEAVHVMCPCLLHLAYPPRNSHHLPLDTRILPYSSLLPLCSLLLKVIRLPRLEHTCSSCFPACIGTSCLIRADIRYPRGGSALGIGPPYPLVIFSSGFLVASELYASYAETLASWGYTVMLYDRQETVADFLDDDTCVKAIRDLIDW